MSAVAQPLQRRFTFGVRNLPDPGAHLSPEDVKTLYAQHFPELLTATIAGPEIKGGQAHYKFERAYGTKGSARPAEDKAVTALDVVERALRLGDQGVLFGDQTLLKRDQVIDRQTLANIAVGVNALRWPGPCTPMPF